MNFFKSLTGYQPTLDTTPSSLEAILSPLASMQEQLADFQVIQRQQHDAKLIEAARLRDEAWNHSDEAARAGSVITNLEKLLGTAVSN